MCNIYIRRNSVFNLMFNSKSAMYRIQGKRNVLLGLAIVIFIITVLYQLRTTPDFMDIMNTRERNVHLICNDRIQSNKVHPLLASHIFWLKDQNIAYCPTFKSATSTWFTNLISMLGQPQDITDELKKKYTALITQLQHLGAIKPTSSEWSNYILGLPVPNNLTGFMVVRHPFERLVSAYRDKLERIPMGKSPYHNYNLYGKYFVERYRTQAIKALGEDYFNETNNFGTPLKVLDNRRPNSDLPSFWEFSQAVIERYKMDEHWIPINEYCSICNPITLKSFRYILKFEELYQEQALFIRHFQWDKMINKTSHRNVNRPDNWSRQELTQLYFSVLSKEQIVDLYKVYELDFLLFNYTFEFGNLRLPVFKN